MRVILRHVIFGLLLAAALAAVAGPQRAERSGGSERVELKGGVSRPQFDIGQSTTLWLSLHNGSGQPIQSVCVTILKAGALELQVLGTGSSTAPGCDFSASRLQPRQEIAFTGELRSKVAIAEEAVIVRVSWHGAAGAPSSTALRLESVTVRDGAGEPWTLKETVKDFGVPVLIALIGILLPIWELWRRGWSEESERRQTQEAQTWQLMLPMSNRYTTRYYTKIDAAVGGLAEYVSEFGKDQEFSAEQKAGQGEWALFFALVFERCLRELMHKAGGWYFKSRIGEGLVSLCAEKYHKLLLLNYDGDRSEKLSRVVNFVSVDETFPDFRAKQRGEWPGKDSEAAKKAFAEFTPVFQDWLESNAQESLVYLRVFKAVLLFEMNRPYEYWYGQRECLNLGGAMEETEAKQAIRALADELFTQGAQGTEFIKKKEKFNREVDKYLKEATVATAARGFRVRIGRAELSWRKPVAKDPDALK